MNVINRARNFVSQAGGRLIQHVGNHSGKYIVGASAVGVTAVALAILGFVALHKANKANKEADTMRQMINQGDSNHCGKEVDQLHEQGNKWGKTDKASLSISTIFGLGSAATASLKFLAGRNANPSRAGEREEAEIVPLFDDIS